MIVKFFTRGTGSSSGVFNYLLKDKEQTDGLRVGAELLRGDIDNQALLIDSLDFKQKYTSGCLSFTESPDKVTDEQKNQLMDGFERTIRAGLDVDRVAVSWIEHRDKGRLELNFVFANVDLEHGRAFQPYLHRQDKRRVNAWKDMQNIKYGFTDPNDPINKRLMGQRDNLPRDVKDARQAITDGIKHLAKEGVVTSRTDVIQTLEAAGFEIVRETDKAISIKNPNGKRNIRLTGGLYERDFRFSREVQATVGQASKEYRARDSERYRESKQLYECETERKRKYNEERHGKPRRDQGSFKTADRRSSNRFEYRPYELFERYPSPYSRQFKTVLKRHAKEDAGFRPDNRKPYRATRGQNKTGHPIQSKTLDNSGWFDSHSNADVGNSYWGFDGQQVLKTDLHYSTAAAAADQLRTEVSNGQTTARSNTARITGAAEHNTAPKTDVRHQRQRYSAIDSFIAAIGRDADAGITSLADEIQEFNRYHESVGQQHHRIQSKTQKIDAFTKHFDDRLNNAVKRTDSTNRAHEQLSKYNRTARQIKQQNERIREDIEGIKDFTEYNQDYAGRNKRFAAYNREDTTRIREGVDRVREVKQEVIKLNTPEPKYSSPRPW